MRRANEHTGNSAVSIKIAFVHANDMTSYSSLKQSQGFLAKDERGRATT